MDKKQYRRYLLAAILLVGLLPVLGGTGSMRMGIGRTGKRKVPPDLQGSAIF